MSSPFTPNDRHRIILKLEALWNAQPDVSLFSTIIRAELVNNTGWTFDPETQRDTSEETLDRALAEVGVTVSGGWKS